MKLSTVQGAEFPFRGESATRGVAVLEAAALFAIGTVAAVTVALFFTERWLRRPRSNGESPTLGAVRRNSCRTLLVMRNFTSPGPFLVGVAGGSAAVACVPAAAGGAVVVAAFALAALG